MFDKLFHHRFTFIECFTGFVLAVFFMCQYALDVPGIGPVFRMFETTKLKYVFAAALVVVAAISISRNRNFLYLNEIALLGFNVFILVVVSICFQLVNGFKGDTLNEALYFIVPAMVVWALINYEHGAVGKYIDFCFYLSILSFFTQLFSPGIASKIAAGQIGIDFINSFSTFESGLAFFSVVFVFYYSVTNQTKKKYISLFLCVLSLKRISLVFAVIFFVFGKRLRYMGFRRSICVLVFCLIPVVITFICNDKVALVFRNATGLDLNQFMMGRFDFINLLVDSDQIKYGLGSCRSYLSNYYQHYYNTVGIVEYYDAHNDVLRFFLECTILGSFSVAYSHFHLAKEKSSATILIFYVFFECCFNHLFGAGNTAYWILVYLTVFCMNEINEQPTLTYSGVQEER